MLLREPGFVDSRLEYDSGAEIIMRGLSGEGRQLGGIGQPLGRDRRGPSIAVLGLPAAGGGPHADYAGFTRHRERAAYQPAGGLARVRSRDAGSPSGRPTAAEQMITAGKFPAASRV